MSKTESEILTEVPGSLKKLARLVVRGFYNVEHVVVVDMLIRNPCVKEDDLVDLLKLERKQLRAVIAQLKNDKLIKSRLRMETAVDGKSSRQNYYYINYKVFVNVVKYKLDHMRRKLETEERDNTSRASFKCPTCSSSFTDLEANQLCDFTTGEFRCTYCNSVVEEDESALPKQDSRLLVVKFNEQLDRVYSLLRDVEDIRLAPELLEPEPIDVSGLKNKKDGSDRPKGEHSTWSGDATRNTNFNMDQDVTINIGDDIKTTQIAAKERPVWMVESTVSAPEAKINEDSSGFASAMLSSQEISSSSASYSTSSHQDDIMQALLAHERKGFVSGGGVVAPSMPVIPGMGDENNESESSHSDDMVAAAEVGEMEDDDEDYIPMVTIGDIQVSLANVTPEHIAKMTPAEKAHYIQLGQEVYSNMYE